MGSSHNSQHALSDTHREVSRWNAGVVRGTHMHTPRVRVEVRAPPFFGSSAEMYAPEFGTCKKVPVYLVKSPVNFATR